VQNDPILWEDVTNYLHAHEYSLKHCFLPGIVPATIDLIVNGYWLLKHFDQQDNLDQVKVKLTSMLLLSHTITLSGNLVKTGVIFQLNPLALNWKHILRCLPLVVSWINEGIERENMIRTKLDEEWVNIFKRFDRI
jgi:hypothetical protein